MMKLNFSKIRELLQNTLSKITGGIPEVAEKVAGGIFPTYGAYQTIRRLTPSLIPSKLPSYQEMVGNIAQEIQPRISQAFYNVSESILKNKPLVNTLEYFSPEKAPQMPQAFYNWATRTAEQKLSPIIGKDLSTLVGSTVGALGKAYLKGPTTFYEKKPAIEHTGDVLSTIGTVTMPLKTLAVGAISPLFKAGETLLTQRRLPTKQELIQSVPEGVEFGAKFGPLEKIAGVALSPITKELTAGKELGNINTWVRAMRKAPPEAKSQVLKEMISRFGREATARALEGGVGLGTYEALGEAKTPMERAKKALEGFTTGAIFGGGTYALGKGIEYGYPRVVGLSGKYADKIPVGFTVKPITEKERAELKKIEGSPKNMIEFSKFHQKGLSDVILKANSQDEAIAGVKGYLDNYIAELSKNPNEKAAKGLRAAINRTMYTIAGVEPKLGKSQVKVFEAAFSNPEISRLLETLNEYKEEVDKIVEKRVGESGVIKTSEKIPVAIKASVKDTPEMINIKNEIERLKNEQKALAPDKKAFNQLSEGGKILYNQLERKIAKLLLEYENLKLEAKKSQLSETLTTTPPLSSTEESIGLGGKVEEAIPKKETVGPSGMKERGFVKTVREAPTTAPEVAKKIEGTYFPKTNKELIAEAKKRIAESYDEAKAFVMERSPKSINELDQMIATGELLMEKAQNEKRFDEAIEIAERLAEHGTKLGRGVQAFSIWSRLTPQGMLRYAEKMIKKAKEEGLRVGKVENLTEQETKLINEYMTKAQKATTPEEKTKFVRLAMETINQKIPWKVSELFDMYRINNILSNPRSHMRNIWGNAINTFIFRPLTLTAEGRPIQAIKYEVGALKSLPQAIDDAIQAFKGENLELGKIDIESLRRKKGPWPISISLRALESMDKFFSRLIEGGEIARGRTPEQAKQFADYILYRTKIGDKRAQGWMLDFLDRSIGRALQSLSRTPLLNWFVPFARTVFNVAKMQIEYSPLGFVNLPGAEEKRTQIAKALLGSLATLYGAKLALEGRSTFAPPTDEETRKWYYGTGRRPFSVLLHTPLGDKWVNVAYFGPFGLALMLPAMFKYYSDEAPTALSSGDLEKMAQVATAAIYYWSQQTPLTGMANFVETTRGRVDLNVARNLGFTASQVIPYTGFLNYVAQVLDPIYRKPRGFGETIMASIPGLSKKIKESYTTPTGEPAERPLSAYFAPYTLGTPEQKYEPFYQERIREVQLNRLINQVKKSISEEETIDPAKMTLVFGEESEKTKEPLKVLIERKKLQAKYDKADKLFDLYLQAPDQETASKIEKNIASMGIDFNEGFYNYLSKQETALKAEYVEAILEQTEKEKWLNTLIGLRKEGIASQKPILSDGVIDQLYEDGLITNEQKKFLKNVKWSSKEKKFTYVGGAGTKTRPKTLSQVFSMVETATKRAITPKATKTKTLRDYLNKEKKTKKRFTLADLVKLSRL